MRKSISSPPQLTYTSTFSFPLPGTQRSISPPVHYILPTLLVPCCRPTLAPFSSGFNIMTSITQLLSPWPVTKHSVVLREQVPPHAHAITSSDYPEIMQHSNPASPNDNLPNSDPSSVPSGTMNSTESDGGENNGDGRKGYGKRELSTSKRAAQNRAAQVSSLSAGRHPFSPRLLQ